MFQVRLYVKTNFHVRMAVFLEPIMDYNIYTDILYMALIHVH